MHTAAFSDGGLIYPAMPFAWTRRLRAMIPARSSAICALSRGEATRAATRAPFPPRQPLSDPGLEYAVLPGRRIQSDPTKSAEWNRGAYLVRGLGHCSMCHSRVNALGASPGSKWRGQGRARCGSATDPSAADDPNDGEEYRPSVGGRPNNHAREVFVADAGSPGVDCEFVSTDGARRQWNDVAERSLNIGPRDDPDTARHADRTLVARPYQALRVSYRGALGPPLAGPTCCTGHSFKCRAFL